MLTVSEIIPILQLAIGPVVLISGISLLILSMTNRLGRVIDRGRILVRELAKLPEAERQPLRAQLGILSRRAGLLRNAIGFATVSVFLATLLIVTLFLTAALKLEDAWLLGALFMAALASLMLSLAVFLQEVAQALVAFRLDIGEESVPQPTGKHAAGNMPVCSLD